MCFRSGGVHILRTFSAHVPKLEQTQTTAISSRTTNNTPPMTTSPTVVIPCDVIGSFSGLGSAATEIQTLINGHESGNTISLPRVNLKEPILYNGISGDIAASCICKVKSRNSNHIQWRSVKGQSVSWIMYTHTFSYSTSFHTSSSQSSPYKPTFHPSNPSIYLHLQTLKIHLFAVLFLRSVYWPIGFLWNDISGMDKLGLSPY